MLTENGLQSGQGQNNVNKEKKRMKKIVSLMLAACLLLGCAALTGCGST